MARGEPGADGAAGVGVPMVSVVVCTRDRPGPLRRALASVLSQEDRDADFGLDVVVVDDGSRRPVRLAGDDPRVRLIRLEGSGVGAARAAGLGAARGELVAYCDDDDEWTPSHLRVLLGELRPNPGLGLVYGDARWRDARGIPAADDGVDFDPARLVVGNFVYPSAVLHRVDAARDVGGFDPALRAFEDWDLWLRMSRWTRFRRVPIVVGTHHRDAKCVSAREHPTDRMRVDRFHRRSTRGWHLARQAEARRGGEPVPFDPATWSGDRREILWQSHLEENWSFACVARRLLPAIARQGVDVVLGPTRGQNLAGFERYARSTAPHDASRLGFHFDVRIPPAALGCERLVHYAMWESTLVQREKVQEINRGVSLLYVPCHHNVGTFRERGVGVPIKVLHHGVDAAEFPFLERNRQPGDVFTFGSFGDLTARKGMDVLLRAFGDEFRPREPVRLLLKTSSRRPALAGSDPRATILTGFLDQGALLRFLGDLDAFVLPSRGEGFGLCGLEAMATGLPVVATNWSGPVEYLDPADSLPLAYELVDAAGTEAHGARYFGTWAEPDYAHLRSLLRWLYEHPAAAAAMGRRASVRIHADWTWDRAARQMRDDLDLLAAGVSPVEEPH